MDNNYEEDEVGQNEEEEEYDDDVEVEDEDDDDEDVEGEEEELRSMDTHSRRSHRTTQVKTGGLNSRISGSRRLTRSGTVKADNTLLPIYRKGLRNALLEYLEWMYAMKNDSIFR